MPCVSGTISAIRTGPEPIVLAFSVAVGVVAPRGCEATGGTGAPIGASGVGAVPMPPMDEQPTSSAAPPKAAKERERRRVTVADERTRRIIK